MATHHLGPRFENSARALQTQPTPLGGVRGNQELLLHGGSSRAADAFVGCFRDVLNETAEEAERLRKVYQRGPPRESADHAVGASREMLEAAASLRKRVDPALQYIQSAPKQSHVIETAQGALSEADRALDAVEAALERLFGIQPVAAPVCEQQEPWRCSSEEVAPKCGTPAAFRQLELEGAASPATTRRAWGRNSGAQADGESPALPATPTAEALDGVDLEVLNFGDAHGKPALVRESPRHRPVTPCAKKPADGPSRTPRQADPKTPSTPNLHDFGIDEEEMRGISKMMSDGCSGQLPSFANASRVRPSALAQGLTRKEVMGVDFGDDDAVSTQIEALGIQTPMQLAERYGSGADGSSKTPPTRAEAGIETPMELASRFRPLACESSADASLRRVDDRFLSGAAGVETRSNRKILDFDSPSNSSVVRSVRARSQRMAMRNAVDSRYHDLPDFLKRKVPLAALLSASEVLLSEHQRTFRETDGPLRLTATRLSQLIQGCIDLSGRELLVLALQRTNILQLERGESSSVYTFDGF